MKRYIVFNLLKIGNVHVQRVEYKQHSEFNQLRRASYNFNLSASESENYISDVSCPRGLINSVKEQQDYYCKRSLTIFKLDNMKNVALQSQRICHRIFTVMSTGGNKIRRRLAVTRCSAVYFNCNKTNGFCFVFRRIGTVANIRIFRCCCCYQK